MVLMPAVVLVALAGGVSAQTAPAAPELTKLLKEFLDGASRNDAAVHDRFWAGELVYTGSSGRRRGKADILGDLRSASASTTPAAPPTTFSAEDIRIQQHGNTAVVAFRLVGTTEQAGRTRVTSYLNTGTFVKRGRWQAVAWQATRMARPVEEAKQEVSAVEAAIHRAMLASDVKALESLLDESFIWTHRTGDQETRQALLAELGSGRLKYSKLETSNVAVSVLGDTAVVRGASHRQRSPSPGPDAGGDDSAPFNAFYTLTLVDGGSGWRAVALHTSWAEGQ